MHCHCVGSTLACKACQHVGDLGACPPGNFEKLHSQIESEGIFSDRSPFNAPVDTGTQTLAITCIFISMQLYSYSCKVFQKVAIFKYSYYYLL